MVLRYLAHCRRALLPGRAGGNVYSIRDDRNVGYAAATIRLDPAWALAPGASLHSLKPELAQLVRSGIVVDAAEGLVDVSGQRVGGGDLLVSGLDLDGAVAAGGADEFPDGPPAPACHRACR